MPGAITRGGLLLHVLHYAPAWCRRDAKQREEPFDVNVALELNMSA